MGGITLELNGIKCVFYTNVLHAYSTKASSYFFMFFNSSILLLLVLISAFLQSNLLFIIEATESTIYFGQGIFFGTSLSCFLFLVA